MQKSKTQGVVERLNLNQLINRTCPCKLSCQDIDDLIAIIGYRKHIERGNDNCYYCIIEAQNDIVMDPEEMRLRAFIFYMVEDISLLKEQKGDNMTQEFLKLNADPNYYRLDLAGLRTNGLCDGFEHLCEAVAKYLATAYKIKTLWGWGAAKYDKGTVFQNNDGYYLFFKAPSPEEGERIEHDIIILLGPYELYHRTEDYRLYGQRIRGPQCYY